MEIIPVIKKDINKQNIEAVINSEKETKYLGSIKKIPGHTIFKFNRITKQIDTAEYEGSLSINTNGSYKKTFKIVIDKDCFYDSALNKKNFIKKLLRYGIIKKQNGVIIM